MKWCRWRDSDRKNELFQNPLLSHYPPTTQKELLHYSRTPIESDGLEHLSTTRHYSPITNQLLTNYSFIIHMLALSLALRCQFLESERLKASHRYFKIENPYRNSDLLRHGENQSHRGRDTFCGNEDSSRISSVPAPTIFK
jgi:hypothetical protein